MMRIEFGMACLAITVPEKVKYTTTLICSTLHSIKLLINLLNAVIDLKTFGLKHYCLLIASMILYTMIIIVAFCM